MKGAPMHDPVDVSPLDVRGSVRVELFDDRTGRLVERQDGENFVSLATRENLRWWQRMMFARFSPGTAVADSFGTVPYNMPRLPLDHLAYWTDDAAEDPATEYRVRGEVIGWASRWPVGSPSGRRGVVDTTLSVNGPGYSTWVANWTSSQGVGGPFQSVGWTRLDEANAFPMPRFPDPDIPTVTFNNPGGTNTFVPSHGQISWDPVEGKWLQMARHSGGSPTAWQATYFPEAGGNAASSVALATTPPAGGWVVRYGTDYIGSRFNSTNDNGHLARWTSAGVQVYSVFPEANGTSYSGGVVTNDGKLWTCNGQSSTNSFTLNRHNPATGAIELRVTPWRSPTNILGLAYDPDGDYFWISAQWDGQRGIARLNTDGTFGGIAFGIRGANQTVTASAPFSGSYTIPATSTFDPWQFNAANAAGANSLSRAETAPVVTTSNAGPAGTIGGGIVWKDGTLYCAHATGNWGVVPPYTAQAVRGISGHNLGTRLRLSSPVTKTNAQNLRITYRFDFA